MNVTKKQQQLRAKILDTMYVKGPISRIDISKQTGITPATVSEITGTLIEEKLVHEIGEDISMKIKSGRKKILLAISEDHSYYIGIELSEKYFSFCLSNNKGRIIKEKIIKPLTRNQQEIEPVISVITELTNFEYDCEQYNPIAIGVSLPGHFNKSQYTISTNNSYWENFDLKKITDHTKLPVYFENNVKCMALSERIFGNSNNDQNYAFLHVGLGMFCSSIYQGQLYGEDNILVGEIGHTISHPDGELCECGKRGCLQTYASEAWIIKKSKILYENSDQTYLRQLTDKKEHITIAVILQAYSLGDEGTITILHNAIKYLSIAINNISMIISTSKIIIHGQLFTEPQLELLLKEYLDKNVTVLVTEKKVQVEIKKYSNINGALAASGLCVFNTLLNMN